MKAYENAKIEIIFLDDLDIIITSVVDSAADANNYGNGSGNEDLLP